ncbi:putative C18B11.03c-like protein [Cladobotryum mycophilum]|uniref:C18B11.03c-like protein n=1 Tax=Cladobotryum mycophilum TaxID=491253 RepID=A0ABR0S9N9_9HYPO
MDAIRSASLNEQRFIISEALGLSHCVITAAKYTSMLSAESQLESLISKAVKHCIDVHPVLSTNIEDANGDHPRLTQVDDIDLDHHLTHVKSQDTGLKEEQQIKNFLESAHGLRLPTAGERPQWRVYVSESLATDSRAACFYLAFVFSHVFTDGMSGIAFHSSFLRSMNGVQTTLEWEHRDQQPGRMPLPPIETAGNLTISWSYLVTILVQEFLPTWLASALGVQVDNLNEFWTVPNSTVKGVLQACRKHNARLTSLLNYLTARALCKSLSARGQSYQKIKVGSAIDLRRALGKGQGCMANWVSVLMETFTISEHDGRITDHDWDVIRQSTVHLAKASSSLADQPIGLIKYITNMKQWTHERASQPATVSFGTSNLGVFNGATCKEGVRVVAGVWRRWCRHSRVPLRVRPLT